jgi:hypothetical protein
LIEVGQVFSLRERESKCVVGPFLTIERQAFGWKVIDLSDGYWTWMSDEELTDIWLATKNTSYYELDERLF